MSAIIMVWLAALPASGFSLMGPYADWMAPTNSYRMGWDVGGPVNIGEGYRWNVPVVSYGFDQSFLDYFGSNGVSGVERAIQALNNLPPASVLVQSNFSTAPWFQDYQSFRQGLLDLKSASLAILLEQMGLAEPQRSIFVLKRYDPVFMVDNDEVSWPPGTIPNLIIERNFDPQTLMTSHWINDTVYTGWVLIYGVATNGVIDNPWLSCVETLVIDPDHPYYSAIADWRAFYRPIENLWGGTSGCGMICTGLSADDAGGLQYLLSTNNLAIEDLLPDVHGTGTNSANWVRLAVRPGVDKITFIRQQFDAGGHPVPLTNQFTDTYYTNGSFFTQQLERIIQQPDVLFSVTDQNTTGPVVPVISRTGTTNWWNSSTASGGSAQGPGIIRPPIAITFNKLAPLIDTTEDSPGATRVYDYHWASFDTSPAVVYPAGAPVQNQMPLQLWLFTLSDASLAGRIAWTAPVNFGQTAQLLTSSNLVTWVPVTTITNNAGTLVWKHWFSSSQRFFRVVPR